MNKQEHSITAPQDAILLSDLDGTLVEGGFKFNSEKIYDSIANAIKDGWLIGLSSDTPYDALKIWHDRLGMNGPLIAEKGALVELDSGLIYDRDDSEAFIASREAITKMLFDRGFTLWRGNPVEALRTDLHIGNPGDNVALINTLRKCSLGFFFRKVKSDGSLITDSEMVSVIDDIREFYPIFDVDEDFNEAFCLLIVAKKGTSKRTGTKMLMEKKGIHEIGMIGDSIADYLGTDLAIHYAVANANQQFKDRAVYVARNRLTAGVVEILSGLTER